MADTESKKHVAATSCGTEYGTGERIVLDTAGALPAAAGGAVALALAAGRAGASIGAKSFGAAATVAGAETGPGDIVIGVAGTLIGAMGGGILGGAGGAIVGGAGGAAGGAALANTAVDDHNAAVEACKTQLLGLDTGHTVSAHDRPLATPSTAKAAAVRTPIH